ncbi:hypothetical protein BKA93DRAFT_747810 [Sparassis latifolia]
MPAEKNRTCAPVYGEWSTNLFTNATTELEGLDERDDIARGQHNGRERLYRVKSRRGHSRSGTAAVKVIDTDVHSPKITYTSESVGWHHIRVNAHARGGSQTSTLPTSSLLKLSLIFTHRSNLSCRHEDYDVASAVEADILLLPPGNVGLRQRLPSSIPSPQSYRSPSRHTRVKAGLREQLLKYARLLSHPSLHASRVAFRGMLARELERMAGKARNPHGKLAHTKC